MSELIDNLCEDIGYMIILPFAIAYAIGRDIIEKIRGDK